MVSPTMAVLWLKSSAEIASTDTPPLNAKSRSITSGNYSTFLP
jgi:hypothetical protein